MLQDLGSKTLKTRNLASIAEGNPGGVLVCFWATWCPPCLEELPSLENLNRQLTARKNPNLPKLVLVSVDESPSDVLKLFSNLGFRPTFVSLWDKDAKFATKSGSNRFPETVWIAPDGTVRHKWLGPQDWLSEPVQKLLGAMVK